MQGYLQFLGRNEWGCGRGTWIQLPNPQQKILLLRVDMCQYTTWHMLWQFINIFKICKKICMLHKSIARFSICQCICTEVTAIGIFWMDPNFKPVRTECSLGHQEQFKTILTLISVPQSEQTQRNCNFCDYSPFLWCLILALVLVPDVPKYGQCHGVNWLRRHRHIIDLKKLAPTVV